MTREDQFAFLKRLSKGIAKHFGSNCEVTVHDISRSYEDTIVAIENGHVSGRKVGDGASEIVLKALKDGPGEVEDVYAYFTRTKEGRVIKSSSFFVRDGGGKAIGLLGINYDISELIMVQSVIENFAKADVDRRDQVVNISTSVNDLLDQLIEESVKAVGRPVALMTKEDKIQAIQYLNEKGAFLIKKSGDKVSKYFDISKYTLYNYLDAKS